MSQTATAKGSFCIWGIRTFVPVSDLAGMTMVVVAVIMAMDMFVAKRLMRMDVNVALHQKKRDRGDEQSSRQEMSDGERLMEHRRRESNPDEGRAGENDLGSRGAKGGGRHELEVQPERDGRRRCQVES
jgi:hypothetical protein